MSIIGIFSKFINWIKNRKDLRKLAIEKRLFNTDEDNYGSNYRNDLLEQYKLYVELTDRINERLHQSNSFFLSINLAAVGGLGYVMFGIDSPQIHKHVIIVISLIMFSYLAMIFCGAWVESIRSYSELRERKFKIIDSIEERLPLALFCAESKLLESKKSWRAHNAHKILEKFGRLLLRIIYFASFCYHTVLLIYLVRKHTFEELFPTLIFQ